MITLEGVRLALGTTAAPGDGIVIETSGTTATPKRVRLSARALRASANAVYERLGGAGQWLLALPTTYVAGANVLVRSVLADVEPIVMPAGPFTAVAFAQGVELMTGSRRYTSLVPVQLARLLEGAELNAQVRESVAKLDAILVGGQASAEQQLARARDLGWNVIVTYGSTETCGGAVYDGVPLEGVDVRIVAGEIWIGGATLADGFENADASADPELTAARFVERDGQRWFRTDDAGELIPASDDPEHDGAECLVVTGRRDRVIISGGIKISLSAIEDATRQMRGVVDCLAVGVANDEWGQRPVLGVELGEGANVSREDVERHIERTLGHVSVPDRVVVEPLLRNANGKPDVEAFLAGLHR